MKKYIVPAFALTFAASLIAQSINVTIPVTLTAVQARGVQRATAKFNADQLALNINFVALTPGQYLSNRIADIIASYNTSADLEDLQTNSVQDLWLNASAAKRAAAVAALK